MQIPCTPILWSFFLALVEVHAAVHAAACCLPARLHSYFFPPARMLICTSRSTHTTAACTFHFLLPGPLQRYTSMWLLWWHHESINFRFLSHLLTALHCYPTCMASLIILTSQAYACIALFLLIMLYLFCRRKTVYLCNRCSMFAYCVKTLFIRSIKCFTIFAERRCVFYARDIVTVIVCI